MTSIYLLSVLLCYSILLARLRCTSSYSTRGSHHSLGYDVQVATPPEVVTTHKGTGSVVQQVGVATHHPLLPSTCMHMLGSVVGQVGVATHHPLLLPPTIILLVLVHVRKTGRRSRDATPPPPTPPLLSSTLLLVLLRTTGRRSRDAMYYHTTPPPLLLAPLLVLLRTTGRRCRIQPPPPPLLLV